MTAAPARSYLFVPGSCPERYDTACAAGADAVIIDLEDAVPAAKKRAAREALASWLSPDHPVLVRINSADSEWFSDDLLVCGLPGVAGIVLPKAEHERDIAMSVAAGAPSVLPLIESALGLWNAFELARSPKVQRLVFGAIDFSFDLSIRESHEPLLAFRSQLVLVSRVAGIAAPVDGVTVALNEPELLRDDTARARALGFGAKLCIHPKQLAVVHAAFAPSAKEVTWAQRVLHAAANANGAAVAVDGKMVDRPVILTAQRVIEEAARAP
jgi:citrate lyase subunit beta/citryl-CoA lyase